MAPSIVFLIHEAAMKNAKNISIDEIIFYLKSWHSTDNRNQIVFIQDIVVAQSSRFFNGCSKLAKKLLFLWENKPYKSI